MAINYGQGIGSFSNPMGMQTDTAWMNPSWGIGGGGMGGAAPAMAQAPTATNFGNGQGMMGALGWGSDGLASSQFPMAPTGGQTAGGMFGNMNWNALGNIANLIGGFGGLYSAYQGTKIAKDSLNLQREAYQKNLANQTKSYNTALSDRAKTRGVMEGSSSADVDKYIRDNSL